MSYSRLLAYFRIWGLMPTAWYAFTVGVFFAKNNGQAPDTWQILFDAIIVGALVLWWLVDLLVFCFLRNFINRSPEKEQDIKAGDYFAGMRWKPLIKYALYLRSSRKLRALKEQSLAAVKNWAEKSPAVVLTKEIKEALNDGKFSKAWRMVDHLKYRAIVKSAVLSRKQVEKELRKQEDLRRRAVIAGFSLSEFDSIVANYGKNYVMELLEAKEKEHRERLREETMKIAEQKAQRQKEEDRQEYFDSLQSRISKVENADVRIELARQLAELRTLEWAGRQFRILQYEICATLESSKMSGK